LNKQLWAEEDRRGISTISAVGGAVRSSISVSMAVAVGGGLGITRRAHGDERERARMN
jgi:hypothetical protein